MLSAKRLQRLTDLGFNFAPHTETVPWEDRLETLRKYQEKHGHLRISTDDPEMGPFIRRLRTQYRYREEGKQSSMTDERVRQLTELGFEFRVGKTPNIKSESKSWDERFLELL